MKYLYQFESNEAGIGKTIDVTPFVAGVKGNKKRALFSTFERYGSGATIEADDKGFIRPHKDTPEPEGSDLFGICMTSVDIGMDIYTVLWETTSTSPVNPDVYKYSYYTRAEFGDTDVYLNNNNSGATLGCLLTEGNTREFTAGTETDAMIITFFNESAVNMPLSIQYKPTNSDDEVTLSYMAATAPAMPEYNMNGYAVSLDTEVVLYRCPDNVEFQTNAPKVGDTIYDNEGNVAGTITAINVKLTK